MKIEAGAYWAGKAINVPGDRVRMIADDGRTAFEIAVVGPDTLEIRGVDTYKVGGLLMSSSISVRPKVSNVVHVSSVEWDKQ